MYLGLSIGSFCTLFIVREFYRRKTIRTPLNILIITVFATDCLRALLCTPLESFVLIQTLNHTISECEQQTTATESNIIVLNFCRFAMAVRSCFSAAQPLAFIAIAYERLRTIVKRNGQLTFNAENGQQRALRMKYALIWVNLSFLLGTLVGTYQGIVYLISNTCYGRLSELGRIGLAIRLFFIMIAAVTSGLIYLKIYFTVKKYQKSTRPENRVPHSDSRQNQAVINNIQRKDLRSAKNTFVIFLSFFLCRVPFVMAMWTGLIFFDYVSLHGQCYYEEFSNFSLQIIFIATISDPLVFIYSQSHLRKRFTQLPIFSMFLTNSQQEEQQ